MLNKLMEMGILVEPDAVDKIKTLKSEEQTLILDKCEKERPLTLSSDLIDTYLKRILFKVLKKFVKKKKYSIDDFVKVLNDRLEFLKTILMKKTEIKNLVSINKLSFGESTIIGMVKEVEKINGKTRIVLEDVTGSTECSVDGDLTDKLSKDDVIAISGNYRNQIFFGNKIIFPGIPLRSPKLSSEDFTVSFLEKPKDVESDYVICIEGIKTENTYIIESNPSIIEINGIKILILLGNSPLNILRKRYFSENNDDFLIDPVPDIVLCDNLDMNYKGISIVSLNKKINLKNREIEDI